MHVHPSWHMTGLLDSALAAVPEKKGLEHRKGGAKAVQHLFRQQHLAEKAAKHVGMRMQDNHGILFSTVPADDSREKCQPSMSLLLSDSFIWRCRIFCFAMVRVCADALGSRPNTLRARSGAGERAEIGEVAAVGAHEL